MTAVVALLRAEVRKLTTTAVAQWLVAGGVGLAVVFTILGCLLSDVREDPSNPMDLLLPFASGAGSLLAAVLGAVGITGEYRHSTATPTFLAGPVRHRVMTAKLIVYSVAGGLLGAVCCGLAVAIAVPWLTAKGFAVGYGGTTLRAAAGGVAVSALYAAIGVAVGGIARSQLVGVAGFLLYINLVEPSLLAIPKVQSAYPYLPGGGAGALVQGTGADEDPVTLLAPWQGGLLLLTYALVLAIAGTIVVSRRDVS